MQIRQSNLEMIPDTNPTVSLQSPTIVHDTSSSPFVTLTRIKDDGVETIGYLTAVRHGVTFSCATIELPWKDNMKSISCIPKGTYYATLQPFHDTHMYELSSTFPRTGIFLHPMNYHFDSLGCIGLGQKVSDINHDGESDITDSQNTVAAFIHFMDLKPFTLTIK